MKRFLLFVCLVIITVLVGACNKPATATTTNSPVGIDPVHRHLLAAQPRLPAVQLWLGTNQLTAELARKPVEIHTGMMFRTNMLDSEGMLFVFPAPMRQSFYMRNCSVALSAAYISPDGEILEIIDLKPFDETGIPSAANNVQFVLEVPQGWFQRHNVNTGAVIRTEKGSLQQSFF